MNPPTAPHLVEADPAWLDRAMPALVDLLQACVAAGASIGWPTTPDEPTARAFWRGCMAAAAQGERRFWLALADAHDPASVVGSTQLAWAGMPNGRHRADVMKVMVHPRARRQGLASALLAHAEHAALEQGRWLLVLDTLTGSDAERLYTQLGYQHSGYIPDYAVLGDGSTGATTMMFKRLGRQGQQVRPTRGDSAGLRALLPAPIAPGAELVVLAQEADGTPCGCAALRTLPDLPRSAEISPLVAARPGRGTGRLLLRHLEHEALRRGWHTLQVSVEGADTAALAFFGRQGYAAAGPQARPAPPDNRVRLVRRLA